jgi:hypothetical protein
MPAVTALPHHIFHQMFQTIMVKDRHRSIEDKGVLYYERTFVELLFNYRQALTEILWEVPLWQLRREPGIPLGINQ